MGYLDCPQNIVTKYKGKVYDYKNKDEIVDFYFRLFLAKTQSMFKWKNLPKTITERDLELLLQTNGSGIFLKSGENYFILYGSLGGLWNQNYMPTMAIVHNPYVPQVDGAYNIYYDDEDFKHTKNNLETKGDCVVITNDSMYIGLEPIINTYANRLAETYISRRMVTIMSRYINVFVAKDNNAYESIKGFLQKVEKGELAAVFDEDKIKLFENGNIYTLPMSSNAGSSRMLTELIECEQYDKASFYNELGLQANYNMKRESINSNEAQLNEDAIMPFIDNMLECRKLACERINKLFGLNLSVEFSSAWKIMRDEIENALNMQKAEVDNSKQTNRLVKGGENDANSNVNSGDGNIGGDLSANKE